MPARPTVPAGPEIFNLSYFDPAPFGNLVVYPNAVRVDTLSWDVPYFLQSVLVSSSLSGLLNPVGVFVVIGLSIPQVVISNSFKCLLAVADRAVTDQLVSVQQTEYPIYIPPKSPISLYSANDSGALPHQAAPLYALVSLQLVRANR